MMIPVHVDERRALYELGLGGDWKVLKYLDIKEDCSIGNHYHKYKDELFLLVKGEGVFHYREDEFLISASIQTPFSTTVSRGTWHRFDLKKGSILLCLASAPHDPNDDHYD